MCSSVIASESKTQTQNRKPLMERPYIPLDLGDIKPKGLMLEMLKRQASGMTGNMPTLYPEVCGVGSRWIGGDLENAENMNCRGPYWVDGLVSLAYLLDDADLKAKAQLWIDAALDGQRANGYIGADDLANSKAVDGDLTAFEADMEGYKIRNDYFATTAMLKSLMQYYSATKDERVLPALTKYFKYLEARLLAATPTNAVDEKHIVEGRPGYNIPPRAADNIGILLWLYNNTGDKELLPIIDLMWERTYNWQEVYENGEFLRTNPLPNFHCVNLAHGFKHPVMYSVRSKDMAMRASTKKGLEDIKAVFGFVNGMFGSDEHLHGNVPTMGSEFCTLVEMMFTFESVLPETGDMYYADYLEKLAYNALPTQHTDDFTGRQYFQQVNQVQVTAHQRDFHNDGGGHLCFGVLSGFPCCSANMHQGWPKFVQNLWYATADKGIAALVYGESEATIAVGKGRKVTVLEETNYPFREDVKFTLTMDAPVAFPFHLRVPGWCSAATIEVNGKEIDYDVKNNVAILKRTWKSGDVIELHLPMEIKQSRWNNNSLGVERGPLVYALKVGEDWRSVVRDDMPRNFWQKGVPYWEVYPTTPWNYTMSKKFVDDKNFDKKYTVVFSKEVADYPWNLKGAPITIKAKASIAPYWQLYNHSAGPIPSRSAPPHRALSKQPEVEVELIPYGCTTLRVAQIPVAK